MPTPTASDGTRVRAADPAAARAHFAARLAHETDCADVHTALAAGAANFVLLDVRSRGAYAEAHVPGAASLPHAEIAPATLAAFGADVTFVVYCWGPHCNGAQKAALEIAKLGRPVKEMIGGIWGWREEGYATEPGR